MKSITLTLEQLRGMIKPLPNTSYDYNRGRAEGHNALIITLQNMCEPEQDMTSTLGRITKLENAADQINKLTHAVAAANRRIDTFDEDLNTAKHRISTLDAIAHNHRQNIDAIDKLTEQHTAYIAKATSTTYSDHHLTILKAADDDCRQSIDTLVRLLGHHGDRITKLENTADINTLTDIVELCTTRIAKLENSPQ